MSASTVSEAPQSHRWRILLILSALMAFASISTDLYLPAMPEMGKSLHANDGQIELTVSGFLVGFSLGQLVWGVVLASSRVIASSARPDAAALTCSDNSLTNS